MENELNSLWEIMVPTTINGKPVRTRYHRVWDAKVRAIAGGLTILTPVRGHWVDPDGETFIERMIPVRISCTEEEIIKISDMTAAYYKQRAVIFYPISPRVYIRYYKVENDAKPGTN